jgi:hypothetical protein
MSSGTASQTHLPECSNDSVTLNDCCSVELFSNLFRGNYAFFIKLTRKKKFFVIIIFSNVTSDVFII